MPHVDPIKLQRRLFAELSRMYANEVPMYDRALLVNAVCNRATCDLLAEMFPGFAIDEVQLSRTGSERHGAIRIGTPEEYRWVSRFFACFGMEPHNFYDMTAVGAKSQPVISTAFRSSRNPEHRIFTSLLRTDYFDEETGARIEARLARRQVFPDEVRENIERREAEGGLSTEDADRLIELATTRIFKWTGEATDQALYDHLCEAGFKIAADVACFGTHHLNHLTPNTFCMDLYTTAMRWCLREIDETEFLTHAVAALEQVRTTADQDVLCLLFRHLDSEEIDGFDLIDPGSDFVMERIGQLRDTLAAPQFALHELPHHGFKDHTEGPATGVPLLLRQDAYKALAERTIFTDADGTHTESVHTARFGEIEQRFYACTPKGRALYDRCLGNATSAREAAANRAAATADYAECFADFPRTLSGLLEQRLVWCRYEATAAGRNAAGMIGDADLDTLLACGFVRRVGQRYEDFLPVSAAGIFASNLSQYGTRSTAAEKPEYTQAMLEQILGRDIIDPQALCAAAQSESLQVTYAELGLNVDASA